MARTPTACQSKTSRKEIRMIRCLQYEFGGPVLTKCGKLRFRYGQLPRNGDSRYVAQFAIGGKSHMTRSGLTGVGATAIDDQNPNVRNITKTWDIGHGVPFHLRERLQASAGQT